MSFLHTTRVDVEDPPRAIPCKLSWCGFDRARRHQILLLTIEAVVLEGHDLQSYREVRSSRDSNNGGTSSKYVAGGSDCT